MGWGDAQVKTFVKRIRKDVGEGWRFLTPEIRSAVVDSFVLGIVTNQDSETVRVEDVQDLRIAMLKEFALIDTFGL